MGKRFLALLLSALIVFTEISSGQMVFSATEVSGETGQGEVGTDLLDDGELTEPEEGGEEQQFGYDLPFIDGPENIYPTGTVKLEKSINYWDYMSGENRGTIEIKDESVSVSNELVTIEEREDNTGWNLHAGNELGKCVVSFTYIDAEGNEAEHSFTINICTATYSLNIKMDNTDYIVPGESKGVSADLTTYVYDETEGCFVLAEKSDVNYKWSLHYDEEAGEIATVTSNEDNTATVKIVNSNTYWDAIEVVAEVWNENETQMLASATRSIYVVEEYYYFSPGGLENLDLEVGEERTVNPEIWCVTYSEGGEPTKDSITEGVRFLWECDFDTLKVTGDGVEITKDNPYSSATEYKLQRIDSASVSGWVQAEFLDDEETTFSVRYEFIMNSIDVGEVVPEEKVYFKELNADDHVCIWINSEDGGDIDLAINTNNFEGENIIFDWYFGFYTEDGGFESLDNSASSLFSLNNDGSVATIHGAALLDAIHATGRCNNDCHIKIVAMENDQELKSFGTWIEVREDNDAGEEDGSEYDINLNLRGDGYSWMYLTEDSGEDYELTIEPNDLLNDYSVEWSVEKNICDEHGTVVRSYIPSESAYTVSEDGATITLHAKTIADELVKQEIVESAYEEPVKVCVVLKNGDEEFARKEFYVEIRPETYRYFENHVLEYTPNWLISFRKNRTALVENATYPNGEEVPFEIESIVVNSKDDVLELIPWEDGTGWDVACKNAGDGQVIITYIDINEEVKKHTIDVHVRDKRYEMDVWSDNYLNRILPGKSTNVNAQLFYLEYENGQMVEKEPKGKLRYEWSADRAEVTVKPNEKNPSIAQITVEKSDVWYEDEVFRVGVAIYETIDDKEYCRGYMEWQMYVYDCYYYIVTPEKVFVQPGETVEVPAILKYFSLQKPEGEVVEGVTFGIYQYYGGNPDVTVSDNNTSISVIKDADVPKGDYVPQRIVITAEKEGIFENYLSTLIICNHDYKLIEKEVECESDGYKKDHCDICGHDKNEVIEKAPGHTTVKDAAVAATCTKDGLTEGTHCSKCKTVFVAQKPVKASGHKEVKDAAVAATCTKDGKTEGAHCSVCKTVTKAQTVVKATGHSSEEVLTKATTSKDGSIVKKCKTCGTVETTTTIPKIATVELKTVEYTYNGKEKKPSVIVKDSKGNDLANGEDYKITYASGRKNPGRYEVSVSFTGNYDGSEKLYFTIAPKATSISSLTPDKKTFTAKWATSTKASGYEIAYSTTEKFTKTTTKTVVVDGEKSKSKKITGLKATEKYYVKIRAFATVTVDKKQTKLYSEWSEVETVITEDAKGKISGIKSVELSDDTYKYDGKVKSPDVIIKDKAGNDLEEGIDYKVTYASGCKNPGAYKVTVTYIGNYKSLKKVTLYFTITPKAVSIKKLTAASKGFKVTYGKGSGITGYEIEYSTSKKFTKSTTKSVTVSKAKTTSKTISKLTGNKKYYVRIRTYKTVKIDGKSVKLYSDWSASKNIKTKK